MEISIKKYMQMVEAVHSLAASQNLSNDEYNLMDLSIPYVKDLHKVVYLIADDNTRTCYQEYTELTLGEYTMICNILDIAE